MRFKIDCASHIVGSKFAGFALLYFVFEGNFPSTSPRGAYIWRGNLTEGFLRYRFGGLIFGGAYTWRGLFSEFYGILKPGVLFRVRGGNRNPDFSLYSPAVVFPHPSTSIPGTSEHIHLSSEWN